MAKLSRDYQSCPGECPKDDIPFNSERRSFCQDCPRGLQLRLYEEQVAEAVLERMGPTSYDFEAIRDLIGRVASLEDDPDPSFKSGFYISIYRYEKVEAKEAWQSM